MGIFTGHTVIGIMLGGYNAHIPTGTSQRLRYVMIEVEYVWWGHAFGAV